MDRFTIGFIMDSRVEDSPGLKSSFSLYAGFMSRDLCGIYGFDKLTNQIFADSELLPYGQANKFGRLA